VWDHPTLCFYCDRRITGRHRRVEPFAFRGWDDHGRPLRLDRTPSFHAACWAEVRTLAGAGESWEAPVI
jgi:hypothetical protein